MKTETTAEWYTVELLRSNPDKIFVFGDNMLRKGKAGQAIIRDEPNAVGVVTKRYPSRKDDAFFSDKPDEYQELTSDLTRLLTLNKTHTLVFPASGLGTGLSEMKERSPFLWDTLCNRLLDNFNFDNKGPVC